MYKTHEVRPALERTERGYTIFIGGTRFCSQGRTARAEVQVVLRRGELAPFKPSGVYTREVSGICRAACSCNEIRDAAAHISEHSLPSHKVGMNGRRVEQDGHMLKPAMDRE